MLERLTESPPDGAALVKVTVHWVLPGGLRVVEEQFTALGVTWAAGRVMVPDPPLAGIESPIAVDATTPVTCTGMVVVDGLAAIWKVAVATVPLAMAVELKPNTRQVFPLHVMLFPALTAEGPATTVTPVMSEE